MRRDESLGGDLVVGDTAGVQAQDQFSEQRQISETVPDFGRAWSRSPPRRSSTKHHEHGHTN